MSGRHARIVWGCLLIGTTAAGSPLCLAGQNPDLGLTEAERDSLLANYHQTFPIWGRKAIERGVELPQPLGFNLGVFTGTQDVEISDLGLGFNQPPQPVGFITFDHAAARMTNVSLRVDLWLFPFLNVYGVAGRGSGHTTVRLAEPVVMETGADFRGGNAGFGLTGAFGLRRNFVVVDFNHSWGFSSLLDAPVPVNLFSARLGRAFRVGARAKHMRLAVWAGAMLQSFTSATTGSIALADVMPPGADTLFTNYQNSTWYQALGPAQRALVDDFVARLHGALDTTIVNYQLNKKVADPWNVLVGATFDFGRHWGLRSEVGFVGRKSGLLMANYRVPL